MTKFSFAALSDAGFEGWLPFDRLLEADPCPQGGGVYVVNLPSGGLSRFSATSCGGWFKGKDPTVPMEALTANWVNGAETVYIGKADNLRRRLREFAKFGSGHPIGHWGGRLIWQLENRSDLQVAWKLTPGLNPLSVEAQLIADFRAEYGKPPFANDPHRLGV